VYSLLGLLGISCFLLTSSEVSLVGTGRSKSLENLLLLVGISDSSELSDGNRLLKGENGTGDLVGSGGGLELLSGSIVDETLLGLVLTSGEENELRLVGVKSFGVQLKLLFTRVSSSVINGDADGTGEGGGESSSLKFVQGEASAVSYLTSVLSGSGGDNRAERLSGSGEDTSSLCNSVLVSLGLLGGLVEVSLDSVLPVLAEMNVGNDVVVLDHC